MVTQPAAVRVSRDCPLAKALAARLREAREHLVLRWLERIADRMSLPPERVFPTSDLLDHVPLLLDGIASYLENPAAEVSADMPVVGKAMELGQMRHAQGFPAHEILREYEILGGILFNFLATEADQMPEPCEKSELLICGQRLFSAISIIQQTTTTHYLRLSDERVAEREERLRAFNRALSHEVKNHIGAILGAADLLGTVATLSAEERARFSQMILVHARQMKEVVENLTSLARTEHDARHHRHVRLRHALEEGCRRVREAAADAGIRVHLADDIPDVEVNAAVVELAVTNYLTNAIKYADPAEPHRRVDITARLESPHQDRELVVRVADNGLGVPPEKRGRLFERFFRAHETVTAAEGTGLGLSIVRDAVESLGGRAWAEFPERGSVFAFAMPARRDPAGDRRATEGEPEARLPATLLSRHRA
jgi:signal transduction histidine kinase